MLGIVVSRADRASEHIGEQLLALESWTTNDDDTHSDADGGGTVYRTDEVELREFDGLHLQLDGVADRFEADLDLLVFASRHSGETGPLLTAHHTGNFGPADHGGDTDDLARACPNAHSLVMDALEEHSPAEYDVGMECTHHGPSEVGVPSMFVEVGSDDPHWDDPDAARAVARAILDLRDVAADRTTGEESATACRHLVGFGGGHYAPRFTRVVRETDWAVGHLAADWGLDAADLPANTDLLEAAFAESRAEYALVDGSYPELVTAIEDRGYRVVGETWVRAVDGVPLALVDRLESAICPVEDGLRFGSAAETTVPTTDFEVCDLPGDLLAATRGDGAETRAAVETTMLAYETAENGTLVSGRAAVTSADAFEDLIDRLCDILRGTYDTVEREDEAVVARRTVFDPEKARIVGVPDGPKFGRLANGQPVTVQGKTVRPQQVSTEEVDRFPVRFNSCLHKHN